MEAARSTGDMGLEPELIARVRAGSLGPCSTSLLSLLEPIQLVNKLVMVYMLERVAAKVGAAIEVDRRWVTERKKEIEAGTSEICATRRVDFLSDQVELMDQMHRM